MNMVFQANPVSWLATRAGRMGPSCPLWSCAKNKVHGANLQCCNSCTISAQKATEDSQMSYINVRIRPLLNFPRPWKWYYKIAWLSRYFLNRRTLHDLYVNRSVLLVCYKLHLKRKTEDGLSRAGRTNSKQLCLCHNKVKYLKKMSLSGLESLHILILKTLPWKRASRNKNTKRQIRSH